MKRMRVLPKPNQKRVHDNEGASELIYIPTSINILEYIPKIIDTKMP